MKFYRKFASVSLAVFLFYAAEKFCHRQTDGFQIVKIHSDLPASPQWETQAPTSQELENLSSIFSRPFHYLDSGGQCYAFVSEDGNMVLKLFKMHHLRQYPWLQRISLPGIFDRLRVHFLLLQKRKLERVFTSSKIAYKELKKESGLLYLNLNPNPALSAHRLKLIDKLGIAHEVSLAQVPFVLQYKADNAFKTLRFHLLHQDISSAKLVIREIFECLSARYEKGIKDLDPALRRNIGLLKDRAINIDIGSFYLANAPITNEEFRQELLNDTHRMRKWLKKRSKELTVYFDSLVEEIQLLTRDGGKEREKTDNAL
ncbi:MAG: hypothetical protein JSS60_04880 [Verrucomicrobia bacterium]|nr:hypothetical protein [Verrucomicrobiota bacterium]